MIALGGFGAPLEFRGFALERLQAFHGVVNLFDQAIALERMEVDRAGQQGHLHARARQTVSGSEVETLLRFRRLLELRGLLEPHGVHGFNFADDAQDFLGLAFGFLFGQLFLVELHDFLDRNRAVAKPFAHADQFLEHDGRARNRFEHHQAPALHALGNGHFVGALEQRHGAHFPQVEPHGIVILVQHSRRQVQVAVVGAGRQFNLNRVRDRLSGFCSREILVHRDSFEAGKVVFGLFRRMLAGRQNPVHFVGEQVPALLAYSNEVTYLFTRILRS